MTEKKPKIQDDKSTLWSLRSDRCICTDPQSLRERPTLTTVAIDKAALIIRPTEAANQTQPLTSFQIWSDLVSFYLQSQATGDTFRCVGLRGIKFHELITSDLIDLLITGPLVSSDFRFIFQTVQMK